MTKRQIAKAGKLWGLALIAHTDDLGCTSAEGAVRKAARSYALQGLARLGFEPRHLLNEADCLKAVTRSSTRALNFMLWRE